MRNPRCAVLVVAISSVAGVLVAAETAWQWTGSDGPNAMTMLIVGDIDIQRRADPTTAFVHVGDTLKRADLVYANLEGMLVKPQGPEIDIPDKRGWRHPGPEGVLALKAWNVNPVGVANNVAYDRANILETLRVLDAHGIAHTGGGRNLADAHRPAIVERKGVKVGFLQYTARWYQDGEQLATETAAGVAKISSRDGVTIDPADVDRVRDDIRRLRPLVDVVVVSHHNRDGATATQFPGPSPAARSGASRDQHVAEEYQKRFAHLVLDAGADLVYGHGTHTVQGVEIYDGKPILYAIGHSAFDQPGYEKSKDGLVVRAIILGKKIVRVSFVPVSRDDHNDVYMLEPSSEDGTRLVDIVRRVSPSDLPLPIEGHEVVLIDRRPVASTQARKK
ncbi:MAG TPA: CapA family protein [Vicinamibacterales bacterium]|nr:CapA family protein [Vicinamibacterales bacterium]